MTDLQKFILSYLLEDLRVDPPDGKLGYGAKASEILQRAGGHWGLPTIVRALNRLCLESGAAKGMDKVPGPWVRLIPGASGPSREWVMTQRGETALALKIRGEL